jgi:hypothetical protein
MKVLLGFANDESFLVSPELAERIKQASSAAGKYVTTTNIEDPPAHRRTTTSRLTEGQPGQAVQSPKSSVFEKSQQRVHPPLTPHQQSLAERIAKKLTPPTPKR